MLVPLAARSAHTAGEPEGQGRSPFESPGALRPSDKNVVLSDGGSHGQKIDP
jgi:hypothetical protein